ncbi:MAG: hemolysin family protein [Bacteriovoracaceae bacterium]
MYTESVEVLLLIFCLILSCLFSGSESALLALSADRIHQLIEEKSVKGFALKFWADQPSDVLTTILIGNNLANTIIATLTGMIAGKIFDNEVIAISVVFATIIILIFGEILPKTFARGQGERFAIPIIMFIKVSYYILYPVVKIFAFIINSILGENAKMTSRSITKNDLEFYISKAEKDKSIDSKQIDLLSSILEFPRIKVKDIMVTRNKVLTLDSESNFRQTIEFIKQEAHSRYPVIDGDLDKCIGILHVKDLVYVEKIDHFTMPKYVKPPFFVYEHMKLQAVFDHMKRKKVHMALVKDETGLVVGMITLEDILEEIVGQIQDEHDDESPDLSLTSNEEGVVVEGSISLRDLSNDYEIEIPLNDNYSTLAGFLLEMLGNNFPKKGNIIISHGYSFELRKVVSNEIKEVKILAVDGETHIFNKNEEIETDEKSDAKESKGKAF